ncbi:MBL fold metallo-hydrolase [Sphingomonas sp. LR61]|uniref:MBL fold metallo-hydrolase n=1 Tax=Bacteria TaxID=2 RepID=UPI00188D3107|nr:MBL fold metallo-hydrolase [Curtobacterium sp. VKM Ac-2887]MBF4588097.1 MBL fold metallo-hydrolase [Curtobacterium sp. VKM Ac-2887]
MSVTTVFGGVSNVLVSDGTTSLLVDGFFSRPSFPRLMLGRLRPDVTRIEDALARFDVDHLDAVLVSHSHADHALDAPVVADRTGAELGGSASTRMIATGYGLDRVPFRELHDRESFAVGAFTVTPLHALHSDGDAVPGEITEPVTLPARMRDFRTGGCSSFLFEHPDGSVLVHPTANFIPGAFAGLHADTVYLGAGAAGAKPTAWIEQYWQETVGALRPSVVRPVHWDAFWRPLTRPLRPLPKKLDRLDVTMRAFTRLADADGVDLRLPELWQRETVSARSAS